MTAGTGSEAWSGPEHARRAAESLRGAPNLEANLKAAHIYTGADTIAGDINLLPDGLDMYASYVDNFGGFGELAARFAKPGGPFLLSITIFGNRAVCADMEPGAMNAGDFPHWYDNVALKDNGPPWGYTSASNMQAVIDAAGGRPFIRWSAHYGFGPHICGPATCGYPQADWTQWDDVGPQGQNFDRSIGSVLPGPQPPPPPKPEEYMSVSIADLAGVPTCVVEAKDGSLWYTYQPQDAGTPGPDRAWKGGKAGQQIAGLVPFAPAPGK